MTCVSDRIPFLGTNNSKTPRIMAARKMLAMVRIEGLAREPVIAGIVFHPDFSIIDEGYRQIVIATR